MNIKKPNSENAFEENPFIREIAKNIHYSLYSNMLSDEDRNITRIRDVLDPIGKLIEFFLNIKLLEQLKSILGLPLRDRFSYPDYNEGPFYLWHSASLSGEGYDYDREGFEDRVASLLIASLISKINETSSKDKDRLSLLMLAIQLISTNLKFSSSVNRGYDDEDLVNLGLQDLFADIQNVFLRQLPNSQEKKDDITKIACSIFCNHLISCGLELEASKPIPKNLTKAFKRLLRESLKNIRENRTYLQRDFGLRYIEGIRSVVFEVINGRHNGVVYLFDHIIHIMGKNGLWSTLEEIEDLSEDDWRQRLCQTLKDKDLFNFLININKVREISGRYDERALLDFLRNRSFPNGRKIKMADLGFGALGVSCYELVEKIKELDIEVDLTGFDLLEYDRVSDKPENYLVQRFLRNEEGVFSHDNSDEIPDFCLLTKEEIKKIIDWRRQLLEKRKLIGKVDLTEENIFKNNPYLNSCDLVTMRGTVACVSDLEKRWRMIRNALELVSEEDGVILIEGGMTLLGDQNVRSIAIRLRKNSNAEVVYLDLSRRKKDRVVNYNSSINQTLVVNGEGFYDRKENIQFEELGRNYISLPFSDIELLVKTIYELIR